MASTTKIREVPEYAKPIVYAFGFATINWGKMEQALEMLLHSVNRDDYLSDTLKSSHPLRSGSKSTYFEIGSLNIRLLLKSIQWPDRFALASRRQTRAEF
jgi:hypothetical protein